MPAILHLTQPGRDKTALAISLLRQTARSSRDPFPSVWALLATRRQALNFRQRLIDNDAASQAFFNIEFFNFYQLNARLLRLAGVPVRRLSPQIQFSLLRALLQRMREDGELRYFGRIADKRGLAAVLADLIDEFKQNGIEVDQFRNASKSAKDREIAAIYHRYQETLRQSDLADVEGEGWLALATVRRQPALAAQVDLLLVDGYDQFTPVQARLLAALARSIQQVHITLSAPMRGGVASPVGRGGLARDRLAEAFRLTQVNLTEQQYEAESGSRPDDLEQLERKIFQDAPPQTGSGAIELIEMPNEAEEAKAILRGVKRRLLQGARPEDILIALRDWSRYASFFATAEADYGLPLLLQHQQALDKSPLIAATLDLLQLAPRFRRLELLDVLRSPYFDTGLEAEMVDLLDRISHEQQFLGGSKEAWLELIDHALQRSRNPQDEYNFKTLTAEQAAALSQGLADFIDNVRPADRADIDVYISWLAQLLGIETRVGGAGAPGAYSLRTLMRANEQVQANPAIAQRDLLALGSLARIMRDLQSCEAVLQLTLGGSAQVTWERFWSELKQALQSTADDAPSLSRRGRVLVTTAAEARGLPHAHVYIPGLAEGVFPAELAEDPLYLDSKREDLQARGIPLKRGAERIDDQGLFYELISLPRRTLTLSRPTFEAGRVRIESHLWRAVRRVFPTLTPQSRRIGGVVECDESANGAELMLALADQLNRPGAQAAAPAWRAVNWLRAQPELAEQWQRIRRGRQVERGRLSNAPFDRYSGVLSQPYTLAQAALRLGRERAWSASRLKDYGLCGFRYFAKHLLKLEEIREPEAGADALQLGLLNHSILEQTYARISALGLPISEAHVEKALAILNEVADDWLGRAPETFNFQASATWDEEKQMLVNRLAALIKLDFSTDSPLNDFGEPRQIEQLEYAFREIEIDMPGDMAAIRVNGYIDRIDRADDKLMLVDYKTGSARINRGEMECGRDFQMMIYQSVLRRLLEDGKLAGEAAGGLFWHLRDLGTSGRFSTDSEDDEAALEAARGHIARNLKMGRGGQFPVHATALEKGKCARYCEFSRLCRLHVTGRFKTQP